MKKKLIIALGGAAVVVAAIVGVLVYNSTQAIAKYSNSYNKTIGKFTAKTSSEILINEKKNICLLNS